MKNKLLLTTALVAVNFAANVYAADLIVSAGEEKNFKDSGFVASDRVIVAKDGILNLTSSNLPIYNDSDTDLVYQDVTDILANGDITINGTVNMTNSILKTEDCSASLDGAIINMINSDFEAGR